MFLKNGLTDSIFSPCATILFKNKYYYKTSVLEHTTDDNSWDQIYPKHYRDFFFFGLTRKWNKVVENKNLGLTAKQIWGHARCDRWRIMHQYGKGVLKCSNSTSSSIDALNYKYSSMKIV